MAENAVEAIAETLAEFAKQQDGDAALFLQLLNARDFKVIRMNESDLKGFLEWSKETAEAGEVATIEAKIAEFAQDTNKANIEDLGLSEVAVEVPLEP
jgi:hypothetical protein